MESDVRPVFLIYPFFYNVEVMAATPHLRGDDVKFMALFATMHKKYSSTLSGRCIKILSFGDIKLMASEWRKLEI